MRCSFSLTVVIQLDKQKLKNSQNICSNSIVGNKQSGNFSLSSTIRNLVAEPHPFQRCIEFLYTSIPNEIHFSSRCKFFSFFFRGVEIVCSLQSSGSGKRKESKNVGKIRQTVTNRTKERTAHTIYELFIFYLYFYSQ